VTVTELRPRRPHDPDEVLAAFAVAVRSAGLAVTMDRTQAFLRAAAVLGVDDRSGVYWAGRATMCANADEIERYDAVFAAWFSGRPPSALVRRPPPALASQQAPLDESGGDVGDLEESETLVRASASSAEVLRHRDVAELSRADRARLARLFAQLRPEPPERTSARRRRSVRGEVDARQMLRRQLRNGGEPSTLRFRDRTTCARRVVVLVDVSGSMGPYADSLLRWAHTLMSVNRARTEVFTIGTRLTRVTRAMRVRDGAAAVAAAGDAVPDWSGGTRLGEVMQAFLDRWGQRGVARGAVVVVMSDGWERGDSALLREQMRRLHRLAHRVVWVNPHQGKDGYLPVQGGIVAALPYIDDFVAGHSMATFEQALAVVARA
jgi:uncharacterized protein with von Willebrand factor type A (vWA) domain